MCVLSLIGLPSIRHGGGLDSWGRNLHPPVLLLSTEAGMVDRDREGVQRRRELQHPALVLMPLAQLEAKLTLLN